MKPLFYLVGILLSNREHSYYAPAECFGLAGGVTIVTIERAGVDLVMIASFFTFSAAPGAVW